MKTVSCIIALSLCLLASGLALAGGGDAKPAPASLVKLLLPVAAKPMPPAMPKPAAPMFKPDPPKPAPQAYKPAPPKPAAPTFKPAPAGPPLQPWYDKTVIDLKWK